jgi:AAA domain
VFTAAELQRRAFPPVSYCVPDLIPEGLTIIAGKPKIGKSWLALDVCIAIAAGRICLGERKPMQGDALYAAMEDNPRRLQRRIDRLLSPVSAQWPERLTLANAWRRLDKGGVHDVAQWIEHAEKSALCGLGHITMIAVHCDYRDDDRTLTAWFKLPEPLPGRRELVCEFLLDLHEWLEGRQPAPKLLMPDPHVTLH